jgi:hypothetical protein
LGVADLGFNRACGGRRATLESREIGEVDNGEAGGARGESNGVERPRREDATGERRGQDRGGRWVSSLVVQASRAGPDWVPGLGLVPRKRWTTCLYVAITHRGLSWLLR